MPTQRATRAARPGSRGGISGGGSPPDATTSAAVDAPVATEKAGAAKAAKKSRISGTAEGRGGSGSGALLDVPSNTVEGCVDGGGGDGQQAGAPRRGKRKAASAQEQAPAVAFSKEEVAEAREQLLGWYDRVHRVLPWRRNPHSRLPARPEQAAAASAPAAEGAPAELGAQEFAYRVWVSEIMLQQTQVATVIPYFQKWLARWPTVADLAGASQEDVNQQWAGLGYYRRARYLLDGAKHVMEKLDGSFPTTAERLREIPGVGPYTAAAVASIAFSDAAAAVDGNVIRVVSRLRALGGDPTKNARAIEALAGQLLHPARPGCHNQAMMELGATVCKPTAPSCGACPVASVCLAARRVADHVAAGGDPQAEGAPRVTDFPENVAKAAKREQHVAVCVVKVWVKQQQQQQQQLVGEECVAAAPPAKRRRAQGQGSILSFLAAPQQGTTASSSSGGGAGESGAGAPESEEALARGGAAAWYLLVQRPAQGLLAGLWECPGVEIADDTASGAGTAAAAARRALADGLLARLGVALPGGAAAASGAAARLVARRQLGSVVHVFSHIRQTSHVEQLVLSAPSLEAACQAAGVGAAGATAAAAAAADGATSKGTAGRRRGAAAGGGDEDGGSGSDGDGDGEEDDGGSGGHGAAGAAAVVAALRWVSQRDLRGGAEGLTSGVRKVLALAHALDSGADEKAKGGKRAAPKEGR